MKLDTAFEQGWSIKSPEFSEASRAPSATKPAKAYGVSRDAPQFDREALKEFMTAIEKFSKVLGVSLKLHFHEESKTIQAEVRDSSGEKVLRKIPPDEVIELAVSIRKLSGLLTERSL